MNNKFKDRMNQASELERAKKYAEKRRAKSEKGVNVYSGVLSVICDIIAALFFVYGSLLLGVIFIGIGALMTLVVYLSVRLERKEKSENQDNKK